jgi:uncharacterized membrane protein
MRALPTQPEPLWIADFRERVSTSLWFTPLCCTIGAIVLAAITIGIDRYLDLSSIPRDFVISNPDTAASFVAVVAAGTLAFVGVVFSTTLIAIQLSASQYSPRVVRVFIRSRLTHVTLGLFIGTFVYSLATLANIRSEEGGSSPFAPAVSTMTVLVLVLVMVFGFIAFLHHITRLIRVQYLLESVARDTRQAVDVSYPPLDAYVEAEPPVEDVAPRLLRYAGNPGILSATDLHPLVELCRERGCWVDLRVSVGHYLAKGTPFAAVHGPGDVTLEEVEQYLLVRGERTLLQDAAFGFRQLVDVGIRALSPAINDPTTAGQSLDRLADLLVRVGERPPPTGLRVDGDGVVRVRRPVADFDRLAGLAFTEITRYGCDSPQVVRKLDAIFDFLDDVLGPEHERVIGRQRHELAVASRAMPEAFADVASMPDPEGFG